MIIREIQTLRACAAISVVLVHFNQIALMVSGTPNAPIFLYPLASGVDLFFVISGFIMVHTSADLFGRSDGWRIFLARRVSRIVPIYWLTTVAMAVPAIRYSVPDWPHLFYSLLFIPYPNPNGQVVPVNGVGWTLNLEVFFYCIFAATLFFQMRIALPLLATMLVVIAALGAVLAPQSLVLRFWSDPIILEFVMGALLALLYQRFVLPRYARAILIVAGMAAIWLTAPSMPPSGYRFLLWGIPAAAIFIGAVFGEAKERPSGAGMDGVLSLLGSASYAIYLIHPIVGTALYITWSLFHFPLAIELTVAFAIVLVVSIGAHLIFERPLTKLFRAMLPAGPRPIPA